MTFGSNSPSLFFSVALCQTFGTPSRSCARAIFAAPVRSSAHIGESFIRTFGSMITIRRYLRLRRETGNVQPKPVLPGPPARKRGALEERLPAQVRLNPDLTLAEHCELFEEEHGMKISTATMSRTLKRLGLPLKKVAYSGRARRGEEGSLAKRGAGDRPRAPRL